MQWRVSVKEGVSEKERVGEKENGYTDKDKGREERAQNKLCEVYISGIKVKFEQYILGQTDFNVGLADRSQVRFRTTLKAFLDERVCVCVYIMCVSGCAS